MVGVEVPKADCVFVAGQQVVQGVQIGYASMYESPVATDNADFLPIDGCGYGADVICVQVYLCCVDVVSDQDGYSSAKVGSVPSGG